MTAPSGGFWPAGSSGGNGVSVLRLNRQRIAFRRCEQQSGSSVRRALLHLPQRRDIIQDPE